MQRSTQFLQLVTTSAAIAAFVVFVADFFFLSDFVAWGKDQCAGDAGSTCAWAKHFGTWWPLWDLVAGVVLAAIIYAVFRAGIRLIDGPPGPRPEA